MKKTTRNILIVSACFIGAGILASAAASTLPLPNPSPTGWKKPNWMTFQASRSISDQKRILNLSPLMTDSVIWNTL